ncbi:MAG: hypothetical protein DRO15_07130 [Thermoprotei archaeon]|nr:MAG: hypothetical protein DRO15_07130 [Thermoprotei archaeon]
METVFRVRLKAVALPELALKYMIARDIALIFNRRHKRFWKTVKIIYPIMSLLISSQILIINV